MGRDVSEMTYDYLTSEAFRREFGQATFFTATDGNHGRGVRGLPGHGAVALHDPGGNFLIAVPGKGDPVVISGESGAVGMGLIAAIMETDEYKD